MTRHEFPDGYVHDTGQDAIDQARAAIPAHLLAGLDRYIRDRLPTGSFLTAVLNNDLSDAYNHAGDIPTIEALPALVRYLHSCLPAPAYGSPEKVKAWLAERVLDQGIREGDEDRRSGE